VVDARIVHANADFARAPSDHDPIAVRMSLRTTRESGAGCRCNLSTETGTPWVRASGLLLMAFLARRGQKRAGSWQEGQRPPSRFLSGPTFSGKDRRP
jgi:hypothetical protein